MLQTEREQRQLAEVLREITMALNSTLNLDELLELILSNVERVVPHDAADIMLLQEGIARVVRHRGYVDQGHFQITEINFPLATFATFRQMVETGDPLLIPDVDQAQSWLKNAEREWIRSYLGAPIRSRGEIVGFLNLTSVTPYFFTPVHVKRLQALTDQVGIAIGNARLLEAERKQREIAETLHQATAALIAPLQLWEVLDNILIHLARVVPYDSASVFLLENKHLKLIAGRELANPEVIGKTYPVDDEELFHEVRRTHQPLYLHDAQSEPRFKRWGGASYVHGWMAIPLIVRGEVIGCFTIDSRQKGAYGPAEAALVQIFADQAAVALSNTQLFEQTQAALARSEALYQATRMLIGVESLDDLLKAVADGATEALPARRVSLILLDLEKRQVTHFVDGGENLYEPYRANFEELWEGLTGWVLREGQPLLSLKGAPDPREGTTPRQRREKRKTGSVIVAPLPYRGQIIGTLTAANHIDEPDFTPQDVGLLVVMANQAAIAIQNARLHQKVQHYANELEARVAERTFELQALYQLAQALGHATQSGEVIRLILLHLYQTLPHDVAASLLITDPASMLIIQSQHPLTEQIEAQLRERLLAAFGEFSQETLDETLIKTHWIQPGTEVMAQPPLDRLGSVLVAPIFSDTYLTGLLLLATEQENCFDEEQHRLLSIVADQASGSIKRLQSLVVAEHQRLERLVAHLPDGIVVLNGEQRLILANHAARSLLTALTQAQLGERLTHLGQYSLNTLLREAVIDPTAATEIELFPNRRIEILARPITGGPEKGGWTLIIRDVTEERLIQKRIQRQERMAAVGQLAAGIAHDFNNILTSIIGFAELLQINPDLPNSAQADLERITKQGQRAARLVRQILDFSSHTITEKRSLDLKSFLKEVIKLLERTIPEDIRISLEADARDYMVTADLTQVQQAITNLALNARDAMPDGGRLHFQLSYLALTLQDPPPHPGIAPGKWVCLSVRDTGVGIPPQLHTQIFEPFFTTKEVGQGTGLGLAQVYGIIKQHDGYITVESEVGAGATFNIYLPVLAAPGGSASPEETLRSAVPRGNNELILLVEDDASVRYIGATMLQHLGYRVLTAAQGQEALEVYKQHHDEIEVILTDMTMPEMGGPELATLLYQKKPGIKVVILTGYPLKTEAAELKTPGVQAWLQKPLKLEQLAQTLNRLLK